MAMIEHPLLSREMVVVETGFLFIHDLMLGDYWLPCVIASYGLLWIVYGHHLLFAELHAIYGINAILA